MRHIRKGAFRAEHAERTERTAQRKPLPPPRTSARPQAQNVEDLVDRAREVLAWAKEARQAGRHRAE